LVEGLTLFIKAAYLFSEQKICYNAGKMDEKKINQTIKYWFESAQDDLITVEGLFGIKRYVGALFWGHLLLEKILKAHVVRFTKTEAPYTHDLLRLAKLAQLDLSKDEEDLLDAVNRFNIRARYPDYKLAIHKEATAEYTLAYINKIKALYEDLCRKIK